MHAYHKQNRFILFTCLHHNFCWKWDDGLEIRPLVTVLIGVILISIFWLHTLNGNMQALYMYKQPLAKSEFHLVGLGMDGGVFQEAGAMEKGMPLQNAANLSTTMIKTIYAKKASMPSSRRE